MNPASLVILLLSCQGYWVGGQEQSVRANWATTDPAPPAADLVWELGLNGLRLDGGTIAMRAGKDPAAATLRAPTVRVRATLRLAYKLVRRDDKRELEAGERAVHVFPAPPSGDWARRLDGRKLVVRDEPGGPLARALEAAEVPFERVDDLSKVLARPDLVLVAPDTVGATPFGQEPLTALARAGVGVAVLAQTRPEQLAGYPVVTREPATAVRFGTGHPLFDRLDPADLRSWVAVPPVVPISAVRLPVEEPALELAWWPRESRGDQPAPIDAAVVTRSVGDGRLVLCQLPMGRWDADPRSQLFLGNLLSYLGTRPEPTPPPSRRLETQPAAPSPVPTIDFSPGANP